jgi:hypothetical protein
MVVTGIQPWTPTASDYYRGHWPVERSKTRTDKGSTTPHRARAHNPMNTLLDSEWCRPFIVVKCKKCRKMSEIKIQLSIIITWLFFWKFLIGRSSKGSPDENRNAHGGEDPV